MIENSKQENKGIRQFMNRNKITKKKVICTKKEY